MAAILLSMLMAAAAGVRTNEAEEPLDPSQISHLGGSCEVGMQNTLSGSWHAEHNSSFMF